MYHPSTTWMVNNNHRHVFMSDYPHLPNSPEEEEEFAKQESFIRNWEDEQKNKCFLDMTLPELNKLMEKTDDLSRTPNENS